MTAASDVRVPKIRLRGTPITSDWSQPDPACRSSVSTALMTAVGPQQPDYLSHSDAAATPLDRLAQRKALLVGHCR
jgi:hypothetical protein